jgi:hypothetical protein
MADAEVVVRWLNGSQGGSRDRVLAIHRELEALRSGHLQLQQVRERLLAIVTSRGRKRRAALDAQYQREYRQLEQQTTRLNKTLTRYVFRPGVGYVVSTDRRSAGLVPDTDKRGFRLEVGEWELVETDAALSLVRLYLTGELDRVQLCEMCKKRWRVRAKSHYRFCSAQCRESYYVHSPGYHERKKENQSEYRKRIKQREAAALKYGRRELLSHVKK